jgi:chromosome segregation ATPase
MLKSALLVVLAVTVGYLLYDGYQFKAQSRTEITGLTTRLTELEAQYKTGEQRISSLKGELTQTQQAVGSTKSELKRTAQQIQSETQRATAELNQAIAAKADSSQVEAIKSEADMKIGQVSSEVGGVKTEVGTVKTDLAGTKRDLEGTQRQLVDVRENLTAAVAKNAKELSALRLKGERDYFEFEIPKKNVYTKVEDIRLVLKKTDAKKGKYTLEILVDDSRLEKKDRTVNEPVQFLVGRNRVRYEVVVNWVQKDRVGGYLAIPKDKGLSAERAATN